MFHAAYARRRKWPLPAFKLGEQGGALLLLLTYRTLFGGDIGLNGFKLIAVIRVGGCGAQQYASAECAGAKQRSD